VPSALGTYATLEGVKARAGITGTADDALLKRLCDQTNQLIESITGRVFAPIPEDVYVFDGNGTRYLRVPIGIRSISQLELAPFTNAPFVTIPTTDYYLRPAPQERIGPGWPATSIVLADIPRGPFDVFPRGVANVRVRMEAGFDQTPDDIVELAEIVTIRAWQARMAGEAEVIGTSETGGPIIGASLRPGEIALLRYYSRELPGY
jgi:hypothetical protein